MTRRVIVVGGSIGGLASALALRAAGAEVVMFERRTDMADQGLGLALRPEAIEGLRALGVTVDGRPLRAWVYAAEVDGGVRMRVEREAPLVAYTYGALRTALLARATDLDVRLDATTTKVATDGSGARVTIGGETHEADLVVAADGVDSMTRRTLYPTCEPEPAGITMLRGFVPEPDARRIFGADTVEKFMGRNIQLFARGGRGWWLGILVPERTPGAGCMFGWIAYLRDAPDALFVDHDGASHAWAVSTGRMGAQAIDALEHLLATRFAAPISKLARTGPVQALRVASLVVPAMVRGRIALVGDAAHVTPPFTTAGASLAIGDAVALARACSPELSDASLAAWSTERIAAARAVLGQANHIVAQTIDRAPDLAQLSSAEAVAWARTLAAPNGSARTVDERLWP